MRGLIQFDETFEKGRIDNPLAKIKTDSEQDTNGSQTHIADSKRRRSKRTARCRTL